MQAQAQRKEPGRYYSGLNRATRLFIKESNNLIETL